MQQFKPKLNSYKSMDTVYSTSTIVEGSSTDHGVIQKSEENLKANASESNKTNSAVSDVRPETSITSADVDTIPDGGIRACLVVFGAAFCHFTTHGYTNTWGLFQAYYQNSFLGGLSPSTISWISSLQHFVLPVPFLIGGHFFDMGYFHSVFFVSSVILVAGLITGFCNGAICAPLVPIISQWFDKKRPIALGIALFGTSLGGTVFPIVVRELLPRAGFQWTMRILGFIMTGALAIGNLTIRRRVPPRIHSPSPLITLSPLTFVPFTTYCFSAIAVHFGLYSFTTYVASTAVSKGVPQNFTFCLISIMNATMGLGKIAGGCLANLTGTLNYMIIVATAIVVILPAWPQAGTESTLVLVTVFYGLAAGGYYTIMYHITVGLGDSKLVFGRVALLTLFIAIPGLLGPPAAGEVNKMANMQVMGFYAARRMRASGRFAFAGREVHVDRETRWESMTLCQ
uniref:Major facilitator superfamily (MFS) profile domain-containing protein n=1 Tax=Moniliophthora roreri TaxID=221103 RepID=A0A0W0FNX3_MONRR